LLGSGEEGAAGAATGEAVADWGTGPAPNGREGRFGTGVEDWARTSLGDTNDAQSATPKIASSEIRLERIRDFRVISSPIEPEVFSSIPVSFSRLIRALPLHQKILVQRVQVIHRVAGVIFYSLD